MTIDEPIIIYSLAGVIVIMLLVLLRLEIRLRRLLRGKNAKTLEDSLLNSGKEIDNLKEFKRESIVYFKNIEERLKRSVQGVGTIRFNPFKGTGQGGGQSFSTAFINEKGNGAVISSLYSRDRVSVFSKPLTTFNSDFELTLEEKEAIKKAKEGIISN